MESILRGYGRIQHRFFAEISKNSRNQFLSESTAYTRGFRSSGRLPLLRCTRRAKPQKRYPTGCGFLHPFGGGSQASPKGIRKRRLQNASCHGTWAFSCVRPTKRDHEG